MKAMLLTQPAPIERAPLAWADVPHPSPGPSEEEAAAAGVQPRTVRYALRDANRALSDLKAGPRRWAGSPDGRRVIAGRRLYSHRRQGDVHVLNRVGQQLAL